MRSRYMQIFKTRRFSRRELQFEFCESFGLACMLRAFSTMHARVHTAALWGGRFIVGYLTINHLRSRPPRAPTLLPLSPPFGSFDQGPSPLSIPSPPPTERISPSANWKGGIAERIALWWLKGGGWALLVVGPPCRAPPPHHAAAVGGLERLVGRGGGPIGQGAGPRRLARLLQITQAPRRQRLQRAEGWAVDLNSSYGISCMYVFIQCPMCSGRYLVEVVGAAAGLVHTLHPAPPRPRPGRQHRRTLLLQRKTHTQHRQHRHYIVRRLDLYRFLSAHREYGWVRIHSLYVCTPPLPIPPLTWYRLSPCPLSSSSSCCHSPPLACALLLRPMPCPRRGLS
jgi:hypothetical protein